MHSQTFVMFISQFMHSVYQQYYRGSPYGAVVNAFSCDTIVSSNSTHAITFTFGRILLKTY